jgi:beta-fructofuranosidase
MTLRLADCWVWDSWYVEDAGIHHAFYLKASRALVDPERRHRHVVVGHAVSDDLRTWEELPDALVPSEPEAFDDWTTWTGSIVRDGARWRMFYTGSSRTDDGLVQRIGSATSSDLLTWVKEPASTVLEADGRWYEKLAPHWHDEAWRDPYVLPAPDGGWAMLVTARAADGDPAERGVVGLCTSDDLATWQAQPPLTSPGAGFGQLEVAQSCVVDGLPTLLFSCGTEHLSDEGRRRHGRGGVFSVTGQSVLGPFDARAAALFPHPSLYAARLVEHRGTWYLLGFRDHEDDDFVGELTDPIPVTSHKGIGLVPKG